MRNYLAIFILAAIVGCSTPTGPDAPVFPEPEQLSLTITGDIDTVWMAVDCMVDGVRWHEDIVIHGRYVWNSNLDADLWWASWCGWVGGKWARGSDTLSTPSDTIVLDGRYQ